MRRLEKRVQLGDVFAMRNLAHDYIHGNLGLPAGQEKAMELVRRAADLGSADALEDLGAWHCNGDMGLERDEKKAKLYFERAAMRGNLAARHNLGCFEHNTLEDSMHNPTERMRREKLAVAHWQISAAAGSKMSMELLSKCFEIDVISKAEYEEVERAHQEACEEMRSEARDRFIEYSKEEGTYNDNWY